MHRPPKHRRKQWRRKRPAGPSELSRKERGVLFCAAILLVIGAALSAHFVGEWQGRQTREAWLDMLAARYGVTETQRFRIREIEIDYHGTGSIFTRPAPTFAEHAAHRQLISEQIPADTVKRFLADLDGRDSLLPTP